MKTNVGPTWEDLGYGVYEDWGEPLPKGVLIDHLWDGDELKYEGTWKCDGYSLQSDETEVQVVKRYKSPGFPVRKLTQALSWHLGDIWSDYKNKHEPAVVVPINAVLDVIDPE